MRIPNQSVGTSRRVSSSFMIHAKVTASRCNFEGCLETCFDGWKNCCAYGYSYQEPCEICGPCRPTVFGSRVTWKQRCSYGDNRYYKDCSYPFPDKVISPVLIPAL